MAGGKLLADRSCVGMKSEQNKNHGNLAEEQYLIQYQPPKEQAGETVRRPAVNAQGYLSIYENEIEGIYGRGDEVPGHKPPGTKSERQEDGLRKAGGDAPPEIRSGGETILVAEDNPAVRSLLLEVLQIEGYVVIEATDGEEAISVFLENQHVIDLVVLDAVMPRKNGLEAYKEIKEVRAGTRVLLMSGYTEDIIFNKGFEDKAVEFISKPLSMEELLKKVREVLDKT
jgi:CheY-like chemotaxis protein